MRRLLCLIVFVARLHAQSSPDAADLLQRAIAFGQNTRNWRAEATRTMQMSGPGMNLPDNIIQIQLAAEAPLRMRRVNSGGDRTTMICDGTKQFYSGDGHSYYLNQAGGQCNFPLVSFYEPSLMNFIGPKTKPTAVSVVGEDHILLKDGDKLCVLVRIVLDSGLEHAVRTLCIDPARPVILRDALVAEIKAKGFRMSSTTTFSSFEEQPSFAPDTFQVTIPPGAHKAK